MGVERGASREQRAESREQRAERGARREQRPEGREQGVERIDERRGVFRMRKAT
jgi:hypothetical protein